MTQREQHLRTLEERLLQPGTRGDAEAVASLLADDFCGFGSSGRVFDKAQILAALQAESPVELVLSEFQVRLATETVALVTYRVTRAGEPPAVSLRSSVWVSQEGVWRLLFHPGTPSR